MNIKELKVTTEAQKNSVKLFEIKYRDLYEFSPNPYILIDPKKLMIVGCNLQAELSLGYNRNQLKMKRINTIFVKY